MHLCSVRLMDSRGLIEIQKFWGTGARRRLKLMVHVIVGFQFHTFSEVQVPRFFWP